MADGENAHFVAKRETVEGEVAGSTEQITSSIASNRSPINGWSARVSTAADGPGRCFRDRPSSRRKNSARSRVARRWRRDYHYGFGRSASGSWANRPIHAARPRTDRLPRLVDGPIGVERLTDEGLHALLPIDLALDGFDHQPMGRTAVLLRESGDPPFELRRQLDGRGGDGGGLGARHGDTKVLPDSATGQGLDSRARSVAVSRPMGLLDAITGADPAITAGQQAPDFALPEATARRSS